MPIDAPDATDSFSANYAQARERFIAAATAAGGALERLAHPERGPGGEALSTDLAWFGPADAVHVLVLVSGTHGVDGGHAAAIRRGAAKLDRRARRGRDAGCGDGRAVHPRHRAVLRRHRADMVAAHADHDPAVAAASTSADISGDGLSAAAALLPHAEVTVMALEFGTVPSRQVVDALRADAWLHAHGEPLSQQGAEIRTQVRQAFYGDRADWKGMVVGQALLAIRQALSGLQLPAGVPGDGVRGA